MLNSNRTIIRNIDWFSSFFSYDFYSKITLAFLVLTILPSANSNFVECPRKQIKYSLKVAFITGSVVWQRGGNMRKLCTDSLGIIDLKLSYIVRYRVDAPMQIKKCCMQGSCTYFYHNRSYGLFFFSSETNGTPDIFFQRWRVEFSQCSFSLCCLLPSNNFEFSYDAMPFGIGIRIVRM